MRSMLWSLARPWRYMRRAVITLPLGVVCALPLVWSDFDPPSYVPRGEATSWPTADGVGGTHWSSLADIDAGNVRRLEVASRRTHGRALPGLR